MALKSIFEIEGQSATITSHGPIIKGNETYSGVFYVKVENIRSNKERASAQVLFKNDKIEFFKNYSLDVSVADGAPNFIKQAYEHLKTLPEFVNAEDC
jgi:hypothetical protein